MTIKEIAKLAGVSIATVSKIVNNKDQNINPDTRNRVLEIVKEYNYTPYGSAKTLSNAKTFIIGVLLKESNPYNGMVHGIMDTATKHGYGILVYNSHNSSTEELKHITALRKHKVDGILWEPVNKESIQYEYYFSDAEIPITYINAPFNADTFFIDYKKLGYLCAEKLLHWRHEKIGCLLTEDNTSSADFYEGISSCLFEHKIFFSDESIVHIKGNMLPDNLTPDKYTALISNDFDNSLSLYNLLDKLNYKVPSDFSFITISNYVNTPSYPRISYFQAPFYSLGQGACKRLIHLCEKSVDKSHINTTVADYILNHEESLSLPPEQRRQTFAVLGSINVDTTLTIDGFPETGKSTLITDSSSCAGGKGTNQALGAKRLGHEAFVIGKVGNDADANIIYDLLTLNQVPTEGLCKDITTQTGKAYVYVQNDGEVTITYIPGANLTLTAKDVYANKELIASCEYCLLSLDIPLEAAVAAATLAKESGLITILKPSALSSLPDTFYHMTDIFVPNKQEALTFCPDIESIESQAEYFYNQGIPIVIITLGNDGCYVKSREIQQYFPAGDFLPVDATGGADAFISALAVHLSDGYTLAQSVQIAQYAAGFCVSRQGVTTALIDKDTLYTYIRKTNPQLLTKCHTM